MESSKGYGKEESNYLTRRAVTTVIIGALSFALAHKFSWLSPISQSKFEFNGYHKITWITGKFLSFVRNDGGKLAGRLALTSFAIVPAYLISR